VASLLIFIILGTNLLVNKNIFSTMLFFAPLFEFARMQFSGSIIDAAGMAIFFVFCALMLLAADANAFYGCKRTITNND
jgi:hypothetical protein